jgi:hypothetical protein
MMTSSPGSRMAVNHRQVERFRNADRGDDFIFRVVFDVVQIFQVVGNCLAQFDLARVGGVVRLAVLQRANAASQDRFRGW